MCSADQPPGETVRLAHSLHVFIFSHFSIFCSPSQAGKTRALLESALQNFSFYFSFKSPEEAGMGSKDVAAMMSMIKSQRESTDTVDISDKTTTTRIAQIAQECIEYILISRNLILLSLLSVISAPYTVQHFRLWLEAQLFPERVFGFDVFEQLFYTLYHSALDVYDIVPALTMLCVNTRMLLNVSYILDDADADDAELPSLFADPSVFRGHNLLCRMVTTIFSNVRFSRETPLTVISFRADESNEVPEPWDSRDPAFDAWAPVSWFKDRQEQKACLALYLKEAMLDDDDFDRFAGLACDAFGLR